MGTQHQTFVLTPATEVAADHLVVQPTTNFTYVIKSKTVWHNRIIHIYTFSQTRRKNRKWLHFHSYRSIALIVGLNSNFYYLHSALHKLSAVHVSYNCTLCGRIGNNYIVVKMLLKLFIPLFSILSIYRYNLRMSK
jgi:hypothetical protein